MENTKPYNTLFLDRDGVINVHRPNDYVKSTEEFVFIDGVLEALQQLAQWFLHIIIVTNQRGVGKKIMSRNDLEDIHQTMMKEIETHGGRIDHIYISTDIDPNAWNRKPNIGMLQQATTDFPNIDYAKSWMVGDSFTDLRFAEDAGIPFALVGDKYTSEEINSQSVYHYYPNLLIFTQSIKPNKR